MSSAKSGNTSSAGGDSRRTIAIVFGVVLIALIALIALTTEIGQADVPDDAVAVVDGDEISREDLDAALLQAAKAGGLQEVPAEDDPQYDALRDQALSQLLDTAWIIGEADERGIEASDREVQQEFEQTKKENFQTEQEYQDFLEQSGFTQEDVDERVRLQVLSTKIQEQITADAGTPTEEQARDFYDANQEQFSQPEQRDIRLILTPDEGQAQQAFDELSKDNSPESWTKVAAELSTDPQSKDSGGVRQGVTEGVLEEPLNGEVFDAPVGEVEGPVETPSGFYVYQVDTETAATTTSFDDARSQIDQQLASTLEQDAFSAFLADYRDRWTQLTVCAEDLVGERCDNFTGAATPCPDPTLPEDQQKAQLEQTGCPPPVLSTSPGAPGSFVPFLPAAGQPQRPHPPGEDAAAAPALPPGSFPGGAPQAAPQGAPQAAPGG